MDRYEAIFQGVVQGLTEFLPVSSSGHLCLVQHILGQTENNLFFNVMLHLGTLIAVCAVYYKLIFRLIRAFFLLIFGKFVKTKKENEAIVEKDKSMVISLIVALLPLLLLVIPIPFLGSSLKNFAECLYEDKYFILVGISFLTTGFLMLYSFFPKKNQTKRMVSASGRKCFNLKDAVSVGFMQTIAAIFPGLSRSGSTLSVAVMRGIDKQTALDFSFVLAIPSILAAVVLEIKELPQNFLESDLTNLLIGVVVSAIVGFLSIVLFKWMLKCEKMFLFVHYVLIIGFLSIFIAIIEFSQGANMFTGEII